MSRNVLFLHQSADLYGSDKVLLAIASRLSSKNFHPIVVVPVDGPLVEQLRHAGVECHIAPLTRLSRSLLSPRGLLAIPGELRRSFKALDHLLHGRTVAVLHSNTLAVLTGALWARRKKIPHIWHVHEIIVHPRFVKTTYGYLLKWFADRIICISKATQDNLVDSQPTLAGRCRLIWNGLTRDANTEPSAVSAYRTGLGLRNGEVLFAMVGRINRWKGQLLLVEAAGILWRRGIHNFRVVIVGSVVPRQEHFLEALNQAIAASPASANITVQPFTSNVWVVWDSCDVAVIPSTEPEPFGMVALEAMASAKPIIAAKHGGLTEIVIHDQTGWLIPPCNAEALADALQLAVTQSDLRERLGAAGLARYHAEFTLARQMDHVASVYEEVLR